MRATTGLNHEQPRGNIRYSGLVRSSQNGVHPRLDDYVHRHLDTFWGQPLHGPSVAAYQELLATGCLCADRPFVLDSGCGTGSSTQILAQAYPQQLIIGVDRSQDRLSRTANLGDQSGNKNYRLVRADLSTFWRLLLRDGHVPTRHFIFYPNPWPKPGHLLRRWHAHPVFPQLVSLGGRMEMRTNWGIYADEFARAVSLATAETIRAQRFSPASVVSPFEQKYRERGHALFSVVVSEKITSSFQQCWSQADTVGTKERN